jgi:hypothetical protein
MAARGVSNRARRAGPRRRRLLDSLALARALGQQMQVVLHVFIAWILALGFGKLGAGALVIAAQHVGIALVVEDFGGRPDDADGLVIGAVGEIETAQAVIGGGKAEPGLRVARMVFGGTAEIFLRQAEIIGAVLFLAETEIVVGIAAEQTGRRPCAGLGIGRRRGKGVGTRRSVFGSLGFGSLGFWGFGFKWIGDAVRCAAARQPKAGHRNHQHSDYSNTHDKA